MAQAVVPHTSSIAQHLPSSIFYEILQYFSAPLLTAHLDQFPWYLAHICSSWRVEFLSMRRNFWNEITISLSESNRKARKEQGRTLDVLNMFLECNIGYPFSFKLDIRRSARQSPYYSPIFDKIISESARWKRVSLRLGIADISTLYRVKGKLERLESLEFWSEDYRLDDLDYTIPEAFTDLFMSAPYFTRMDIYPLSTWNFNWSIMTVLHLEITQREEVARLPLILSQAMQMETLSIQSLFKSGTSLPSRELITLPNLTALETECLSLLQLVTTPSLRKLHVFNRRADEAELHPTVVGIMKSFISRSQCRIQILALEAFDAASAIEIISRTPDIRVLYMGRIAGMTNVFGWLNEMHRAKTPKLTRLQSLSICDSSLPQGDSELDEISDFVKTRTEDSNSVVKRLQKIDFGGNWNEDEDGEVEEVQGWQLRNLCELYGIQFSANRKKPRIKGSHHRSLDPYVYLF